MSIVSALLRRPEVSQRVKLSKSSIYRLIKTGRFPSPVQLSQNSVAWSQAEIDAWIAQRIAERDRQPQPAQGAE
jgi:prophage regulatory protein